MFAEFPSHVSLPGIIYPTIKRSNGIIPDQKASEEAVESDPKGQRLKLSMESQGSWKNLKFWKENHMFASN